MTLLKLLHRALDRPRPNDAVELAGILIYHGAGWDPSLRNSAGETAIHAAARNGNIDAVKFFVSQNLQYHAASGDYVPLTRFLIREGASVNAAALNGDTPLHLALLTCASTTGGYRYLDSNRKMGSWKLVEVLLNSGADPSARNVGEQTPLDLAKEKGHFFEANFLRLVRNSHAYR
ncbi:ankyrin repeat-containing domain protein [Butyriboletus roseoflavus]|nr:ankyrin repeat-containing domain protein [Butyriboletus roseoflavus]